MVWFTCHVVVVSGDGVSVPDDDAVVACGLSSFGAMFFLRIFTLCDVLSTVKR